LRPIDVVGGELQSVRLVLLIVDGPQEGENEFIEFPSIGSAIAYGRELYGDERLQLDGIEDLNGKLLVGFDHLNELCSEPPSALPERRYG
jgi:hypothetical protein